MLHVDHFSSTITKKEVKDCEDYDPHSKITQVYEINVGVMIGNHDDHH